MNCVMCYPRRTHPVRAVRYMPCPLVMTCQLVMSGLGAAWDTGEAQSGQVCVGWQTMGSSPHRSVVPAIGFQSRWSKKWKEGGSCPFLRSSTVPSPLGTALRFLQHLAQTCQLLCRQLLGLWPGPGAAATDPLALWLPCLRPSSSRMPASQHHMVIADSSASDGTAATGLPAFDAVAYPVDALA